MRFAGRTSEKGKTLPKVVCNGALHAWARATFALSGQRLRALCVQLLLQRFHL